MQKRQKNKFAMYGTVHTFLEDKSAVYADNEEFNLHRISLKQNLAEIRLKDDTGKKATKGKSKNKEVTRTSVSSQALAVAGALYAYAKKSGNQSLIASMNLTKSKLDKLRDSELITELNSIKEKAIEKSADIRKYGIPAEKLESYTTNIETYSKALGAQDTGGAVKKGAYKSLSTLFKDADSLLDSIDKLMENYKDSNEDFYAGYKTARVIKDLGIRHNEEEEPEAPEQRLGNESGNAVK
ncbi:MAG TPA: hypothetical protein PKC91_09920 [Ignavibacteria bacterium]|nr:hypothetical protein [Ignavibacteria bacterium]